MQARFFKNFSFPQPLETADSGIGDTILFHHSSWIVSVRATGTIISDGGIPMFKLAKRMDGLKASVFTSLLEDKKIYEEKTGRKVLDFSLGSPDISPAPAILETMESAVRVPANYRYAVNPLPSLIDAIRSWYMDRYGVKLEEDEICLLQGSQEALSNLPMLFCNPGDIVIIPDPYYPAYRDAPALAQADVYTCPLKPENNFLMDLKSIPEEICEQAKMILVCYPNNPTGAVATDEFIHELIAFAKKYNLVVVYDSAYADLSFDNPKSPSFLSYPGAKECGVELNSFSKTYGMAGARLGVLSGSKEILNAYRQLKSNLDYGIFLPVQYAGITALQTGAPLAKATREKYQARRDLIIDLFAQAGWKLPVSKATMFIWAPIPEDYENSEQFARDLLLKTGIMVTPGTSFGSQGERFIRIALVQNEKVISEAAERLAESSMFKQRPSK